VEASAPLTTPASTEAVAKDWLIVNLLHVLTIEPADGNGQRAKKRRRNR
jgi:hypothetical protein